MSLTRSSGDRAVTERTWWRRRLIFMSSESELVQRAVAGDEQAWRELVRRHSPRIWAVARAHRLPSADAADVVQTTWLNTAEHLHRVRDPTKLAAWLVTTARNESLRVIALRRPLPPRWRNEDCTDGPEHQVLKDARDTALWTAFQGLSSRCQRLLRLYAYAPELTYVQLAAAVGVGTNSVGQIKGRCLRVLRDLMAREGVCQ